MDARMHLPPSFAAAMLTLAAIAYVMAPGSLPAALPRKARPAVDRFWTTSKALAAALEGFEKAQRDGAALADGLGASPAGAERMTDTLDGFRRARDRVLQAAQMFETAASELVPHTAALDKSIPGLREAIGDAGPMISRLRDELRKVDDGALNVLRQTAGEILLRSLADAGFDEWVASLPIEDEPVFDEADVRPIYWDEAQGGWVGGRA
jgi:hypothetical protein